MCKAPPTSEGTVEIVLSGGGAKRNSSLAKFCCKEELNCASKQYSRSHHSGYLVRPKRAFVVCPNHVESDIKAWAAAILKLE